MKIATPWINNPQLVKIFELLGYNARFVGGCVRDLILFNKLVYDIDIATPILPQDVMGKLSKHFTVIPTGLKHGTITVVGKHKYEITTLRKDEKTDGRHADVSFNANWEEDSNRRDFTINALYSDFEGNVYDYHDGLNDLKNNTVRFVGNEYQRIVEDYLRIMRFFRFSMRFGKMDSHGLAACVQLAQNLENISRERIAQEWFKIIEGDHFWALLENMKSILKALHFNCEVEEKNGLSMLGVSALFINSKSHIILSNHEKNYIKNLQLLKLNNLSDAIIIQRKFGNEFINDLMILNNEHFEIPNLGEFPIKGQDLLELGLNGSALGKVLDELYITWVKSLAKMSRDDLIAQAKVML